MHRVKTLDCEIHRCELELCGLLKTDLRSESSTAWNLEAWFTNEWNSKYPGLKGEFKGEATQRGSRRFHFKPKCLEHHQLLVRLSQDRRLLLLWLSNLTSPEEGQIRWAVLMRDGDDHSDNDVESVVDSFEHSPSVQLEAAIEKVHHVLLIHSIFQVCEALTQVKTAHFNGQLSEATYHSDKASQVSYFLYHFATAGQWHMVVTSDCLSFCTLELMRGEFKNVHMWTEELSILEKTKTAKVDFKEGMINTGSLQAEIQTLCDIVGA